MLHITDLTVDYGSLRVVWGVDLHVERGEIVCLLGSNGAGKSTVMNSISNLVRASGGTIALDGTRIDRMPTHEVVAQGVAHVLERRHVFPHHTVQTNLALGAYLPAARARREETLERVLEVLPGLRSRLGDKAGTLSGGLQQQVAIGRGLMSRPKLLLLDEPLIGLSPAVAEETIETIVRVRADGVGVLLIEQNVERALEFSDRGYVLQSGRMAVAASAAQLREDERLMAAYFGTGSA